MRPAEWLLLQSAVALVTGLLFAFVFRGGALGFLLGVVVGVLATGFWLRIKADRRRAAFVDGLPDALQLIASGLSSGYSFAQALDSVVRDGAQPVSGEIGRALAESRLGVSLEDALDNVAARMESDDMGWIVMAVRVQRDVGGNLAEVLHTVFETMRERARIRREVRTLSAEGRMSAWVLIALPIFMAGFQLLFRRDYMRPLYTEPAGIWMLVFTVISVLIGASGPTSSSRWRRDDGRPGAAPGTVAGVRCRAHARVRGVPHARQTGAGEPLPGGHSPYPLRGGTGPRADVEPTFQDRVVRPLLQHFAGLGRRLTPKGATDKIVQRLDLAGNPTGLDLERVLALKAVGLLAGTLAGFVLVPGGLKVLAVPAAALFGFYVPDLLLTNRGQKRQLDMQRTLPDALDLLTISVEAGWPSTPRSRRWRARPPVLWQGSSSGSCRRCRSARAARRRSGAWGSARPSPSSRGSPPPSCRRTGSACPSAGCCASRRQRCASSARSVPRRRPTRCR
jgi:Flp pilus assembly protein TadB